MEEPPDLPGSVSLGAVSTDTSSVRVLLLDDEPANLHLRAAILRQHGYECIPAATIEEATELFNNIDIAVLDYHLGAGQFGTEVASLLRRRRPHVPIIILSATLDHYFGGVEDMHLLKGYSSVEDLLTALSSLEAKRRGSPVVVDARDFFYSRISLAIGTDVLVQIFDDHGIWQYCNDSVADYLNKPRDWFPGRSSRPSPSHARPTSTAPAAACSAVPAPKSRTSPGASSPSPSPFTTTAAALSSPPAS